MSPRFGPLEQAPGPPRAPDSFRGGMCIASVPGRAPMRDRREKLLTLGVAAAALAVQLPIYDRGFSLLDEGYLLTLAGEIARGKLLYRDVYVDNPLPGAFYLLAAWF